MLERTIVALALCSLVACGSGSRDGEDEDSTTGGESPATSAPLAPVVVTNVLPAEGAEAIPPSCTAEGDETCNGVDDDCDDGIDETCGVTGGRLQVTAFWRPGADIDLYVVDPRGETLSFQRPSSVGGGELERSSRGRCEGRAVEAPSIESVRWPEGKVPASGTYEVYLHYWGECLSGAGVVDVIVSVAAGHSIGAWTVRLVPNERSRSLVFDVQ